MVGDNPKETKKISYKQLHKEVSRAANGLKNLGIKKGDIVTIYLTMIPELAYTMLACAIVDGKKKENLNGPRISPRLTASERAGIFAADLTSEDDHSSTATCSEHLSSWARIGRFCACIQFKRGMSNGTEEDRHCDCGGERHGRGYR